MNRGTTIAAILSLAISGGLAYFASFQTGYLYDLILSLFGVFFGAFVAIIAVNMYLANKEKRYAAAPLVSLIQSPMSRYHNDLFIRLGRDKFGTAKWNALIDEYQEHRRNPEAFSPEDRSLIFEMIKTRQEDFLESIKEIETVMSDLISVLGWSFDAKIVGAAIMCKKNISELRINLTKSEEADQSKVVEMYFDVDASGNTVLTKLAHMLDISLTD